MIGVNVLVKDYLNENYPDRKVREFEVEGSYLEVKYHYFYDPTTEFTFTITMWEVMAWMYTQYTQTKNG